jgi:hypothetical protein
MMPWVQYFPASQLAEYMSLCHAGLLASIIMHALAISLCYICARHSRLTNGSKERRVLPVQIDGDSSQPEA